MIFMASNKQLDDEIRLNILNALLQKGTLQPNIRRLQKITGYHKATIKASLDFLEKEGVLEGYGPKISFKKFGYNLEAKVMLQMDRSEKDIFNKFLKQVENDPHLYRMTSIIGSGNWNIMTNHLYPDVESYHKNVQKTYYESIPGIYKLIKDRQIFYATEPYYKNASRTSSVIELIRKKKGYK